MPASSLTPVLVVVLGSLISGITIVLSVRVLRWRAPSLANDEVRKDWAKYFKDSPEAQGAYVLDNTTFLLTQAKEIASVKLESIRATEAKSSARIGIVLGGIGLLSILGGTSPFIAHGNQWITGLAILLLLLALACDSVCLGIGRTDIMPQVDVFNSIEIIGDSSMLPKVSHSLTEGYIRFANRRTAISAKKTWLNWLATAAFALGVLALVWNYYAQANPAAQVSANQPQNSGAPK